MKILLIDNYDSFVYNLYHTLLGSRKKIKISVVENDEVNLDTLSSFDKVVSSPGPGTPSEAGKLLEVIKLCIPNTPYLGVCLGHQALAVALGGTITPLKEVWHGRSSRVKQQETTYLFQNLPSSFEVGRYHSWVVTPNTLPKELKITATDVETNSIMALSHEKFDLQGVQFHPESILTPTGGVIINNFINR